jgi:hypothetical protein
MFVPAWWIMSGHRFQVTLSPARSLTPSHREHLQLPTSLRLYFQSPRPISISICFFSLFNSPNSPSRSAITNINLALVSSRAICSFRFPQPHSISCKEQRFFTNDLEYTNKRRQDISCVPLFSPITPYSFLHPYLVTMCCNRYFHSAI